MTTVTAQLDKSLDTALAEGHGTITIRVVVLEKGLVAAPAAVDETPADAQADEVLPENDKRPVSGFLEASKRGCQCCVFLINGQRQHFWDNQFIVRDLEFKYLRNRMIVVVDCDDLKPETMAELMQGSRHQFYEGTVYSSLESRVVATLKGDPDLRRLEEEAEEELSSLQAGDEAVKATLDQLIEAHHDAAPHVDHGHNQAGKAARDEGASGSLIQTQEVVIESHENVGKPATEPVLNLRPDVATVRIKPNDPQRLLIYPKPQTTWKALEKMDLTFDPPLKELQARRNSQLTGEEVTLEFIEPEDFGEDEYPIETMLRSTATFEGYPEARILERRVVITPGREGSRKAPIELKDEPTFMKVTSRQPIRILVAGPDVHVTIRWDGKDELVNGTTPRWSFKVKCDLPSAELQPTLTKPANGRFEVLIPAAAGLKVGDQLTFALEATSRVNKLSTSFLANVVEPPQPLKISAKLPGGGQRRPPYELLYVQKKDWSKENCWGSAWTEREPGSFEPPSKTSPLTIFINTDMDLLTTYREALLAKKLVETTIKQRINKYTAHIAFHLYQMYETQKQPEKRSSSATEVLNEDQRRDEIQRVSRTLLKLMEVMQ